VSCVGRVDLFLAEPDRLSDAAGRQVAIFRLADQRIIPGSELRSPGARTSYDVVVDALLGYGLQGVPRGEAARAISWIRETGARVVSLDLPSGVDADTGETPGVFVIADATLTLHLPKPGLRHSGAGQLSLADLGIPPGATRRAGVAPPRFESGFTLGLERAPVPV